MRDFQPVGYLSYGLSLSRQTASLSSLYNLNENCTFAIQGTHNGYDDRFAIASSIT
ncbi:MAG: hypothetical protein IPK35_23050 [Saprospiraceae bacterium]|nr:hypothetical protein [Saprospiraceae bacterium]